MASRLNKTAIVTGASSGIGAATALKLVDEGFRVLAAGRNRARTEAICRGSDSLVPSIGDLSEPDGCGALVNEAERHFGRLDLLVNNAGIYEPAILEDTPDDLWRRTMSINLDAPFRLSRAALPMLRATRGAIVNVSSTWGLDCGSDALAYCVSKGALVRLTTALARDQTNDGIRINAVCPDDVDTPMLRRPDHSSASGDRITQPREVAELIAFLASDAASHINGAAIPIAGGKWALRAGITPPC